MASESIYAAAGGTVLAEYTEFTSAVPTWTKSYTYLGSSQLATVSPNGTGGEYVEFNHPDRLEGDSDKDGPPSTSDPFSLRPQCPTPIITAGT